MAKTDTAHICLYRLNAPGPPLPVFLNGQPVGELSENQQLTLAWTDPAHEPHLRVGTAPELAFVPDFRQLVNVRVVRKPADPAGPQLETVPAKAADFDLRLLKVRARK